MSNNTKRPVIGYENIALFQSSADANLSGSNSGNALTFIPNAQSLSFAFDVTTEDVGGLGSSKKITRQNVTANDVVLEVDVIETQTGLIENLIPNGLYQPELLNKDRNIYAVVGTQKGTDISGQNLSGLNVLSFGNCFLQNVSMSQIPNGFLTSKYSFVASNVQAQKFENRVVYFQDFESFEPQGLSTLFGLGGTIDPEDLQDGRGQLRVIHERIGGDNIGTAEGIVQTMNSEGLPGNSSLLIYDNFTQNGISFTGFEANSSYLISGGYNNLSGSGYFRIGFETGNENPNMGDNSTAHLKYDTFVSLTGSGDFAVSGSFAGADYVEGGVAKNSGVLSITHRKLPSLSDVGGSYNNNTATATEISDITIKKLNEFEIDAPSFNLTGDQSQIVTGYFSGFNSYYSNSTQQYSKGSNTTVNIKRKSYNTGEYVKIIESSKFTPSDAEIIFNMQSRHISSEPNDQFGGGHASPETAAELKITIDGVVQMHELENHDNSNGLFDRGISLAKVGIVDGNFKILDTGRFDTHNDGQFANHGNNQEAFDFLDSFNTGEILALISQDTIQGAGTSESSTQRSTVLINLMDRLKNNFGSELADSVTARDQLNFLGIRGVGPIYEERADDDALVRHSDFERPSATVYLPKNISNVIIQPDTIQDLAISLPVNRKNIYSMGKQYPTKRKVIRDTLGSVDLTTLVSDFTDYGNQTNLLDNKPSTSNLKQFLDQNTNYVITVSGSSNNDIGFGYRFDNCKFIEQDFAISIGSSASANMAFDFDISDFKVLD